MKIELGRKYKVTANYDHRFEEGEIVEVIELLGNGLFIAKSTDPNSLADSIQGLGVQMLDEGDILEEVK